MAGQLFAAHAQSVHPSYFPASEQIMSRFAKKNIFASLALMTLACDLMAAPLPLPTGSAATQGKPAITQSTDPLPSWTVTRTFEQLGRPTDTLLLGINSAEQVEFTLRRDRIATEIFGRPITNTLMLGAFARTTGQVSLAALKKVIEQSDFRDAGLAQNLTALERGYEETTVHTLERRLTA